MSKRIEMIQGSSVSQEVVNQIKEISKKYKKIFICLDSNHTHDHVLEELKIYAPLVSKGSYCVVFDTIIEDLPKNINRSWGVSNNPKTAVQEYLLQIESNQINDYNGERLKFIVDKEIESQLLITSAPDGFLKRL